MQKTALTLTVSTLVLAIFGAFLRWLQIMNAFDKETGFPVPGAGTTVTFVVYTVLVIAAFFVVTLFWLGRFDRAADTAHALRCGNAVPLVAAWLLCAAFAAASFILLFTAGHARYPTGQRLLGAFGILGALSLPFLFGKKGSSGAGRIGRAAAIVLTLFYCYWLVFSYKLRSEDPVLWNYALEILAVAAAAAALYFIATYFYGVGHCSRALIAIELGVYFNIVPIFDGRSTALNVLMGVTAVLLMLLEYLLIANMSEKHGEE